MVVSFLKSSVLSQTTVSSRTMVLSRTEGIVRAIDGWKTKEAVCLE